MSPFRTENPVPRVVTFTARGNAALDQLADALVAECDGSPGGIADILELVLEADVEDLAECLSETTKHRTPIDLAAASTRSLPRGKGPTRPPVVDSTRRSAGRRRHTSSTRCGNRSPRCCASGATGTATTR